MLLTEYLKAFEKTHLIFDFDGTLFKLILPWEKWEERIKSQLIKLDKTIYEDYSEKKISLSTLQNKYIAEFGKKTKRLIIENCICFEKNT